MSQGSVRGPGAGAGARAGAGLPGGGGLTAATLAAEPGSRGLGGRGFSAR